MKNLKSKTILFCIAVTIITSRSKKVTLNERYMIVFLSNPVKIFLCESMFAPYSSIDTQISCHGGQVPLYFTQHTDLKGFPYEK